MHLTILTVKLQIQRRYIRSDRTANLILCEVRIDVLPELAAILLLKLPLTQRPLLLLEKVLRDSRALLRGDLNSVPPLALAVRPRFVEEATLAKRGRQQNCSFPNFELRYVPID